MIWQTFAISALAALALAGCSSMMQDQSATGSKSAVPATISVDVGRPGARINPAMWGVFFEDINFGADGGLYAEMVKNGRFEFSEPMMGWFMIRPSLAKGDVAVVTENPYKPTNPHFLRLSSQAPAPLGVSNEGFRGMGVRAGDAYDFSAQVRGVEGSPRVSVEIVGQDGTLLASAPLRGISSKWGKVTTTLHPNVTDTHARMTIIVEGSGTVDFDMVSLFPQKTWKGRPGGLRADMVQMLADLKPGFLRFPGGCIVEGIDLSKRYQWKNTIGPVEDRPLLINRWNYEFKHRPTPDYYQSFGLGFFEYFQLSEDLGAEPLPIINCGMACQFNSGELCKLEDLGPYIQDALDLIEFANGPATSTWGAKRAAMGHPAPFNMKMLGVGNEQWGPQYIERLDVFTKAIKAAHPEIMLVSDSGPSPADERFDFLWPKLVARNAEMVDQHCYANPIWFLSNSHRYDSYDRNGPKVFFGEYAAQSVAIVSTKNRNNLECALAEAAFLTGAERNADVVRMASYAPLFANVEAWQWTPDLIWTDSLRSMATPNYYVQQMYMHNRGDVVLPVKTDCPVQEMLPAGRIGVGSSKASAEFTDVKLVTGDVSSTTIFERSFTTDDKVRIAGDVAWTNYTLTLKARKIGGEGSIVITVCDDGKGAWARWTLGDVNNTQHGILTHFAEQDEMLKRVPGSLENGKWYDVKIVINGAQMECYLDGKLIQSAEILHHKVPAVFASATQDEKTGEVILKIVNPGDAPAATRIHLKGPVAFQTKAKVTVLSGDDPEQVNTFEKQPVAPVMSEISVNKPDFAYTAKPRSFSVIRVGAIAEQMIQPK